MSRRPREPAVTATDSDLDACGLSQQDPFLLLRSVPRAVWYGLAALAHVVALVGRRMQGSDRRT